jgi:hypothetical protein
LLRTPLGGLAHALLGLGRDTGGGHRVDAAQRWSATVLSQIHPATHTIPE